jgi:hypothetical protein
MALGRRQKKAARAEEERQAAAAEEARRAPVGPTEAAPQGELFPVELQEAQVIYDEWFSEADSEADSAPKAPIATVKAPKNAAVFK